jgi:hypothetical protein
MSYPLAGDTITLKWLMKVYVEITHTYVLSFQGDLRYTSQKLTMRFLPIKPKQRTYNSISDLVVSNVKSRNLDKIN